MPFLYFKMPSKGRGIRATIRATALAILFTAINPGFTQVESLFKRKENNWQITLVNEAVAAERRLEDTINFEVSGKIYSVQEDNAGKYSVFDASGNFVKDEDIAQKAIFSRLVYDEHIVKLAELPWKPLYKAYFKAGELMQHAKNALGLIFFENYNIVSAAVEGSKGGLKKALLESLKELSKEAIIQTGKKIIGHPEAVARELAIESYKRGYDAWKENLSIVRALKEGKTLNYDNIDRFLYNSFLANTLMPASNALTTDIVSKKYNTNIDATVANAILALLGRNLDSLPKENIIDELSKALNQSLGQYTPFKRFVKSVEGGLIAYIKKKIELDERALSLIGEKASIKTVQKRYGNGLIAFTCSNNYDLDICTIDPNNIKNLRNLTKSRFKDIQPGGSIASSISCTSLGYYV